MGLVFAMLGILTGLKMSRAKWEVMAKRDGGVTASWEFDTWEDANTFARYARCAGWSTHLRRHR